MNPLETEVCGYKLKNPIVIASATTTRNAEYMEKAIDSGAGAIVAKGLYDLETYRKYIRPRFTILHKKGYPYCYSNYSSEFMTTYTPEEWVIELKKAKKYAEKNKCLLIGSMAASTIQSWRRLAKMIEEAGVDMLEISFSCPNTVGSKVVGIELGGDPNACFEVTSAVVDTVKIPVFTKLTFDGVNLVEVAKKVKEAGAQGISIIGRISSLEIEINDGRPLLASGYAGVGGPWMRPIMQKWVARVAKEVNIPVSASGGAYSKEDVIKCIMCGATTVQICTAIMYGTKGYAIINDFIEGLANYLKEKNISSVNQIWGITLDQIRTFPELEREPDVWASVITEKCNSCGLCKNWCYHDALSFDDVGKAKIEREYCDGCGLCKILCPVEAIEMNGQGPFYFGDYK